MLHSPVQLKKYMRLGGWESAEDQIKGKYGEMLYL